MTSLPDQVANILRIDDIDHTRCREEFPTNSENLVVRPKLVALTLMMANLT